MGDRWRGGTHGHLAPAPGRADEYAELRDRAKHARRFRSHVGDQQHIRSAVGEHRELTGHVVSQHPAVTRGPSAGAVRRAYLAELAPQRPAGPRPRPSPRPVEKTEAALRDLHHARISVPMLKAALQSVCDAAEREDAGAIPDVEVLKSGVKQWIKYTEHTEQLILGYRLRQAMKIAPVAEWFGKNKTELLVGEAFVAWARRAKEAEWERKLQRADMIMYEAKLRTHSKAVAALTGRAERGQVREIQLGVLMKWNAWCREKHFKEMFIKHLINVRSAVRDNAPAQRVFYAFKDEVQRQRAARRRDGAAEREALLQAEIDRLRSAWAEDRWRLQQREEQLTACCAQWWRSEVLHGGWSAKTCEQYIASVTAETLAPEEALPLPLQGGAACRSDVAKYVPSKTPYLPVTAPHRPLVWDHLEVR